MLGGTGSGKTTLIQELACNSMNGKLEEVHWISKVQLPKQKGAEIDSCFSPKEEFYRPEDGYNLKKKI